MSAISRCSECYSSNPRETPIRHAKDCLMKHRQFECSKCGRMVCIDVKGDKKARCFFPFASLNTAILYLKAAEVLTTRPCDIYELIYKGGSKRYKIFCSREEFKFFLRRNPEVKSLKNQPIYRSTNFQKHSKDQIKYLRQNEVDKYLHEMEMERTRTNDY